MPIERNSPLQRGGSDEVGDGVCKTKSNAFHYDLTLTTIEARTRAVPPSPGGRGILWIKLIEELSRGEVILDCVGRTCPVPF